VRSDAGLVALKVQLEAKAGSRQDHKKDFLIVECKILQVLDHFVDETGATDGSLVGNLSDNSTLSDCESTTALSAGDLELSFTDPSVSHTHCDSSPELQTYPSSTTWSAWQAEEYTPWPADHVQPSSVQNPDACEATISVPAPPPVDPNCQDSANAGECDFFTYHHDACSSSYFTTDSFNPASQCCACSGGGSPQITQFEDGFYYTFRDAETGNYFPGGTPQYGWTAEKTAVEYPMFAAIDTSDNTVCFNKYLDPATWPDYTGEYTSPKMCSLIGLSPNGGATWEYSQWYCGAWHGSDWSTHCLSSTDYKWHITPVPGKLNHFTIAITRSGIMRPVAECASKDCVAADYGTPVGTYCPAPGRKLDDGTCVPQWITCTEEACPDARRVPEFVVTKLDTPPFDTSIMTR